MLHVSRRHNTSNGKHVRILCSEDVYRALGAALQIAYDDPEYVPEDYRKAVDELWREIVWNESATTVE